MLNYWVQEIIHNYPGLATVLGLCATCYTVFAFVEDRLSVSAKQEITAWLKSAKDFAANQTLSFGLSRFHRELFGEKQFSMKCLVRTTLFSLTSFLLVFLPYIIVLIYIPRLPFMGVKFFGDSFTIIEGMFFVSFILFVLPLDFLGVAVTRKLASLAGNDVTLKKVALIFISDTLAKAVIFPILFAVFIVMAVLITLIVSLKVHQTLNIGETINIAEMAYSAGLFYPNVYRVYLYYKLAIVGFYSFFVPALLLCSAWVWLYFIGSHVVRFAVFLLDVDKQPVRSIGIVGAAVLTGCYGLNTMAVGGYAAQGLKVRGLIYAANQDNDLAISDYSNAIRLDPKDPSAFRERGRAYAAKQDYDSAISDYSNAIRLDPKDLRERGRAYAAKQDYDSAMADYSNAIRLDPKSAMTFDYRSRTYAAKRDYGHADPVDMVVSG